MCNAPLQHVLGSLGTAVRYYTDYYSDYTSAVRETYTSAVQCNLCGQRGAAYLLPRLEHLRRVSDATAPAAAAEAGSAPVPRTLLKEKEHFG